MTRPYNPYSWPPQAAPMFSSPFVLLQLLDQSTSAFCVHTLHQQHPSMVSVIAIVFREADHGIRSSLKLLILSSGKVLAKVSLHLPIPGFLQLPSWVPLLLVQRPWFWEARGLERRGGLVKPSPFCPINSLIISKTDVWYNITSAPDHNLSMVSPYVVNTWCDGTIKVRYYPVPLQVLYCIVVSCKYMKGWMHCHEA